MEVYTRKMPWFLVFMGFVACKSAPTKKAKPQGYVRAIGVAPIYNHEVGRAKDDALLDAKRNAVRKALGDILSARSEAVDGVLVESKIVAKTQGFIEDHKILSARAISKHEYRVEIEAKINQAILKETVEDVLANLERPRIMGICQAKKNSQRWSDSCVQAMEAPLTEKGFEVVDRAQTNQLLQRQKRALQRAFAGNLKKFSQVALDSGAEVILLAEFSITDAGPVLNSKLRSQQALVNIKAVEAGTARVLASASEKAAYPHIDPTIGGRQALQKAFRKIMPSVISQIMKKWDPNRAQTISMLVTGLDYAGLKTFRSELLEKVRGVQEVNRKGSSGQASKLEIQFVGTSFQLADRLLDAHLPFHIKVQTVKPGNLNIHAVKK